MPVVTTATGAFLVVIVFGMSDGIRAQSASLGHADEIGRAVVLIAVTVLLVGVVEVAVATTRTVAHRTRELGVLGANGIPARSGGRGATRRAGDRRGARRRRGCRARRRSPRIILGATGLAPTGVSRVRRCSPARRSAIGVSIVAALAHQHPAHVERSVAATDPFALEWRLGHDGQYKTPTSRRHRRPRPQGRTTPEPVTRRCPSSRSPTCGSCTSSATRWSRRWWRPT